MFTSIFKTALNIILIFFSLCTVGQELSLDQFKTTKAVGDPPLIFKKSFQDKVDSRKREATVIDEKDKDEYAKFSIFALDNILQTGSVLYGDPMTNFVQKVADRLLENEPKLKSELQFYVLKNNITNALCTGPGVIFVTTGLISQVENEAQLAYVIAHEIVHYQEDHTQKSYNESKKKGVEASLSYRSLVDFYKDHEFEADAKAVKLYHAAGYAKEEINTVFDVLMYSYLTFDEIELDSTFYDNPNIYVPESYFPEKKNPILAFDDYDDSKSTHPNIRKRKDAIADELRKYDHWKENKNFLSEEEFNHIQAIARFETVRENTILGNYVEALYEIYILEKHFPNNQYLQTTKAMVWSNMNQMTLSGRKSSFLRNSYEKEGSISLLYGLFKKLSKEELALLAVRKVEDVYKAFPQSKMAKEIRNRTIKTLPHARSIELNRLEKISYREALSLRNNIDTNNTIVDSIPIENETKYDRIRRIREEQSSSKSITELVDENFAQFLLYDLVSDQSFNELYESEKKKIGENTVRRPKKKSSKKLKYEGDIILSTPHLVAITRTGGFDLDNTLKFYELMYQNIDKQSIQKPLKNMSITLSEQFTTEKYNKASLLRDYILAVITQEGNLFKAVSFDHEQIEHLLSEYTNPYLVLITGTAKQMSGSKKYLNGSAKYINLKTGEISSSGHYSVNSKVKKVSVGGLVHEAFSKF